MVMSKAVYTVVGSDTYLGSHILKHLKEKEQIVFGVTQDEDFHYNSEVLTVAEANNISDDIPVANAEWIVICLDPNIGFEKYVTKLRLLFAELVENEFSGDICYFSSASICIPEAEHAIGEEPKIFPRNDYDLAFATGENMLSVLSCSDKGYAIPHIIRLGVSYGNELGLQRNSSLVEQLVVAAKENKFLSIPMAGDAKRSITHIYDICEAAICLIQTENCPTQVNIPGEVKTIREIGGDVSDKYHVPLEERGLVPPGDKNYFAGDQHLSAVNFYEAVNFIPCYTFKRWLADQ